MYDMNSCKMETIKMSTGTQPDRQQSAEYPRDEKYGSALMKLRIVDDMFYLKVLLQRRGEEIPLVFSACSFQVCRYNHPQFKSSGKRKPCVLSCLIAQHL